jgi:glutamate-1-semialdehyde 2,1-aminomutase
VQPITDTKFEKSIQLYERARQFIPSGVTSQFRAAQRPVPLFIDHGAGSRLFDVDGNEYIDYALGYGPLVLGHCHPQIVAAVEKQLHRGSTFGCQHTLEADVAELMLKALPWAERVAFSNTGTEAVQTALRLARAATGRELIVKFEGDYHGWADNILVGYRHRRPIHGACNSEEMLATGGQTPSVLQDVRVLPWNDSQALETFFKQSGRDVAGVITEAMQCNVASILPEQGFLENLRRLTRQCGVVLIFDEVITGFRLGAGGASEYFGVTPDLSVFGKALAAGYPLSAVAGPESLLRLVEQGKVMHAGTFNGNPIVMGAARAALRILLDRSEDVFGRLRALGSELMEGLKSLCARHEIAALVQGVPTCFHLLFTKQKAIRNYAEFVEYDPGHTRLWLEHALKEGIFQMGDGRWYVSGAHSNEDISLTLEKTERVLERLGPNLK